MIESSTPSYPSFVDLMTKPSLLAMACVFVVTLLVFLTVAPRHPIDNSDAFDYLQMAMNVANGQGFTSTHAFPRQILWFHDNGFDISGVRGVPILYRYPLPIMIEAALIRIGLKPYDASQGYSGLGIVLSALLLFLIATHLFSSPLISGILTLAFVTSGSAVGLAVSGLTEPFSMFLFLAVLMLATYQKSWSFKSSILAGILLALSYLNRSSSLFYTLPVLIGGVVLSDQSGSVPRSRTVQKLAITIAVFVVLLIPFIWRSLALTGQPFFSFSDSRNLVQHAVGIEPEVDMQAPTSSLVMFQLYHDAIVRNFLLNLVWGIVGIRELLIVNVLVLVPFVLGNVAILWMVWRQQLPGWNWSEARRLLLLWWLGCICNLVGVSILRQDPTFYAPFWPIVLPIAFVGTSLLVSLACRVFYYIRVLDRALPLKKIIAATAALLVTVLYISLNPPLLEPIDTPGATQASTVAAIAQARQMVCGTPGGAIISDVSTAVATEFHGCGMLAIRPPMNADQLNQLGKLVDIRAILLSHKTLESNAYSAEIQGWSERRSSCSIHLSDNSELYLANCSEQ